MSVFDKLKKAGTRKRSSARETPLATAFSTYADTVRRVVFRANGHGRIRLYKAMAVQLRAGIPMQEVVTELYDVYSYGGTKTRSGRVQFLNELILQGRRGQPLWKIFRVWVTPQEASLMATGEATSKPELALRQAVFQLEKRSELIALLRAKLTKPAMITLAAIGAYAYIGYSLVPQLLVLMPVEKWSGPTRDMIDAGLFVKNNMLWIALGLVSLIASTVYALPNLRGLIRDKLDKIPPFSVYKAFQGGVFILNLSSSGSAGQGPEEALKSMRETATPYLRERVDDTLRGIRRGLNIGKALENAEHDFPDRESIAFIRTLAGKPGFNTALESSVPSLLEEAINRISSAASFLNILAMALAAHAVGTLLLGSFGIDQAAKAMH